MEKKTNSFYLFCLWYLGLGVFSFLVLHGLSLFMVFKPDKENIKDPDVLLGILLVNILFLIGFVGIIKTAVLLTWVLILVCLVFFSWAAVWSARKKEDKYKEWCKENAQFLFISVSITTFLFLFLVLIPSIKEISLRIHGGEKKRK